MRMWACVFIFISGKWTCTSETDCFFVKLRSWLACHTLKRGKAVYQVRRQYAWWRDLLLCQRGELRRSSRRTFMELVTHVRNVSAFSIQLCGRAATRAGSSFCGKKKKESSEQQHQCWSISFPGRPAVIALVWSIDWVYEIIATSLNYDQRLKSYFLFRMNREAWSERNYRHRS